MLKRNLVKTGWLGQSLLLMAPVTVDFDVNINHKDEPAVYAIHSNRFKADTSGDKADTTFVLPAMPPIAINRGATVFVKSFLKKEDEFLQKMKDRSPAYFSMIDGVFIKYGIPTQLRYLAVVESQLRTNAISHVGAKGLWQFMPVTARELGLKVSGGRDERLNSYKSTVAAAKYLKDLYAEFGDWLLVLAAYNSGPGTVYKAIRKSGSHNFWALQRYLPEESRGHVKRFIGTHFYFENNGSIATQTKAEATAYQRQLTELTQAAKIKINTVDTTMLATASR